MMYDTGRRHGRQSKKNQRDYEPELMRRPLLRRKLRICRRDTRLPVGYSPVDDTTNIFGPLPPLGHI